MATWEQKRIRLRNDQLAELRSISGTLNGNVVAADFWLKHRHHAPQDGDIVINIMPMIEKAIREHLGQGIVMRPMAAAVPPMPRRGRPPKIPV
jgi:hypothetical protein